MKTLGIVALVFGILGIILGALVTIVSAALVPLTDGRTSWDEAMLGIIPGIIVFLISVVIAVIGLVLFIAGRKRTIQK